MLKKVFLLLLLLPVSACFVVGDFGKYWEKGTIDPVLAGTWVSTEDERKTFSLIERDGSYRYDVKDTSDKTLIRTLPVGEHTFLMLKGSAKEENIILRYTHDNDADIITFYQVAHDAIKQNKTLSRSDIQDIYNGVIHQKRFKELTENKIELLETLSTIPEAWDTLMQVQKK